METLKTYLAGLFEGVPDTAATRKAKADLLDLMTDHYHEELAEGKSEAEAIGAAITAVGSIDEVLAALEIDPRQAAKPQPSAANAIDDTTAERYWQANARYALTLGAGVAFCILSIALAAAFGIDDTTIAAVMFFLALGIGVAAIITSAMGIRPQRQRIGERPLTPATKALANDKLAAYHQSYTIGLMVGILCCLLSVLPPIVMNAVANEDLGAPLMIGMIALGVFYIVYVQTISNGYKRLAMRPIAD